MRANPQTAIRRNVYVVGCCADVDFSDRIDRAVEGVAFHDANDIALSFSNLNSGAIP